MSDILKGLRFKKLANTAKPPQTQKARGVWQLIINSPFSGLQPLQAFLGVNTDDPLEGKDEWPFDSPSFDGRVFGRPCPPTPEHGFFDSRIVTSYEDAKALLEYVLKKEPGAELLCMRYIDAQANAVWVVESGALFVGPGHDGATAGKNSVTIPVAKMVLRPDFTSSAGIDADSHTYVELVFQDDTKRYAVQARSGPPVPGGVTEYIPKKMQVSSVLAPAEDLITQKEICRSLAGSTVVFHQVGGSLGSHAAVHCALNKIAYLTREKAPEVGEWIEPVEPEVKFDIKEFQKGVRLSEKDEEITHSLQAAIAILHNVGPLKYSTAYSRLLGYSIGWIFRASSLACLGESRHYPARKGKTVLGTSSRGEIYARGLKLENKDLCQKIATFSYKFNHDCWSAGYGGWKWFAALVKTVKLWNLITLGAVEAAASEANELLDMAHNGGWLFNKFGSQEFMNLSAERPGEALAGYGGKVWRIITDTTEHTHITPRTHRSSKKWTIDLADKPSPDHQMPKKAYSQGLRLKVKSVTWHPIPIVAECISVIEDALDHV